MKFLYTKPQRGVVSLDLSPMDRYREVYARVFDLIANRGGVVDHTQAPSGHGFMARRYNQIRAVRASVIVTSTVAAMSAVTAIQNIYNTARDDIARLPRGRLLPLTTLDVRPSNLDRPMRSPGAEGGPERYSDYFVAARSVLEAAVNATKVLVLFESLCIVNAVVSAKRFIDHRRAGASRAIEGGVAQRSVFSDSSPDFRVYRSTTSDDDPTTEIHKSPKMAVELAMIANKYYSSLRNKKKGLDVSMSGVFSGDSDTEKESKLGVTTVTDDSAQKGKVQSVPPSFRRRNTVLKKLSVKKEDCMKKIQDSLDAREKAAKKGQAFVDPAAPLYEQSPRVKDVVQGLRKRNTAFRDGFVKDPDGCVKVTGSNRDPVVVGAVFGEEGTYAKPSVESIIQDLRSHRTVTTGDLFDQTTAANSYTNLEDEGKAARFSFDDADICCTEVVVDKGLEQKLTKMEEGLLRSSSGNSLAQDAAKCDDAPAMKPDSAGDSCIVNGKQAAVVRPFSVSSSPTSNEAAATRQISLSDLRSKVKDQTLKYASGLFVSCYTAAVMHMSLYFSLREKYRNPTARSRYSDLLYDDELDVINGIPAEDLVSPVVHACRVSLSTTSRNQNTHRNSR